MRANLLGTLAVLAVLVALLVGLPVVNQIIPGERALPVGQPQHIGSGVTLIPPPGTLLDVTRTLPNTGKLAIVVHGVQVRAEAKATGETLQQLTDTLRGRITGPRGVQMIGQLRDVRTDAGVAGLEGTYSSSGGEGLFAAYLSAGTGVLLTVTGAGADLAEQLPAVERSFTSLVFGAGR